MEGYGEQAYLDLLRKILETGDIRMDRTGTGTKALFGEMLKFDMADGFPLFTTKQLFIRGIFEELMFFIRGQTNNKVLTEKGVHIWDEWAKSDGDLGPIYGKQWRNWESISRNLRNVNSKHIGSEVIKSGARNDLYEDHIDQLDNLIDGLRGSPNSRYHIVMAWNPAENHRMALPPCHMMFQCFVSGGRLSLQMYQRSVDSFLGLPFNIASYALLLHLLAQQTGLDPGELTWIGGDTHIYNTHISQVKEQLIRKPHLFPTLVLPNIVPNHIEDYEFDMIRIENYDPWPSIKAPIAV
jgi:thymidylate synthase